MSNKPRRQIDYTSIALHIGIFAAKAYIAKHLFKHVVVATKEV